MSQMSMADLLAKQDSKAVVLIRNQEVEGEVIQITDYEIILDLGSKAEGVLPKRDLSPEQAANLKVGDKLLTFVLQTENESGQVVLGLQRALAKGKGPSPKWDKFLSSKNTNQVLKGKGLEVNKGGLIVEVEGVRGFLPSSQVSLSQASNLEELVGKDVQVTVIEVDPTQNRLIFSHKAEVSEDTKKKLSKLKVGDKVAGTVAAVLPFGIFVSLPDDVEGLVHVSETSWEKVADPGTLFKIGDKVEAVVTSVDSNTGRVNLSIKQLTQDPFQEKAKDIQPEDVLKGTVTKVTPMGVFVAFEGPALSGVEGLIHSSKMEADMDYPIGKSITCLVDSVDTGKRRINLAPFITSTKDLIYK